MAPTEGGKDTKSKSKTSETHGSVLMGMIKSQEQQPKQLTVGGKGTPRACQCYATHEHLFSSEITFRIYLRENVNVVKHDVPV